MESRSVNLSGEHKIPSATATATATATSTEPIPPPDISGAKSENEKTSKVDNNTHVQSPEMSIIGSTNIDAQNDTEGLDASGAGSPIKGDTHPLTTTIIGNLQASKSAASVSSSIMTADHLYVDSSDLDSTLGDDMTGRSSTTSLHSSVYEQIEENGRTYHKYRAGKYMLPNDEVEQNRLDLQHHMWVLGLHGRLHLAPLQEGFQDVLDIGTGTGIWAIEFALQYPSARVLGTDLSPIQPAYVPSNCSFEVDDAEADWVFPHQFDYIHGRLLLSCFKDFPTVVSHAFSALRPGGYLELQDTLPGGCEDGSWNGTAVKEWTDAVLAGAARLGMDWHKAAKYKKYLEDAGFQDVHEVKFAWPSNTWAKGKHYKTIGAWNLQNMLEGMHGISLAVLTRGLGWKAAEVEELVARAKISLADRNVHCYAPIRVVYGRKPL